MLAVTPGSTSGARTIASTSTSMATVSVTEPAMSKRPPGAGSWRGSMRTATTSRTAATTTGAKNTHRQCRAVSRPPVTIPSENPPAAVPA